VSFLHIGELFFTGAFAGLLAGFFGIGGGIVLTPLCLALYPSMGLEGSDLIKVIFGTNMFLVTVFSLSAVLKHQSGKNIDWKCVFYLVPFAVAGSISGSWIASISDSSSLKKAFAVILMISSVMIFLKDSLKSGLQRSGHAMVPRVFLPLLGFMAGFIGSYIGIGGGAVLIPLLILLFNFPIGKVAGTSSAVIIFIGLAGTLSYMHYGQEVTHLPGWYTGYVWWSAAIPLMLGGIPAARAGAWLNLRTNTKVLQHVFGFALFVMGIKYIL